MYKAATSMLHSEVLFLLAALAQCNQGSTFEVGTNRGGATIMMGLGTLLRREEDIICGAASSANGPVMSSGISRAPCIPFGHPARVYSFDVMDFGCDLALEQLGLSETVEIIGVASNDSDIFTQLEQRIQSARLSSLPMTLEEGLCRVGTIKSDCGQI